MQSAAKERLVIIDNELDMLDILNIQLSSSYETVCFETANEALNQLDYQNLPSAFIVDIKMPGLNGLEFSAALKSQNLHIPVIIISGYVDEQCVVSAKESGVFAFLEKPFSANKIRQIVSNAIATRGTLENSKEITQHYKTNANPLET